MTDEEFEKRFAEEFPQLYKYSGWLLFPDSKRAVKIIKGK